MTGCPKAGECGCTCLACIYGGHCRKPGHYCHGGCTSEVALHPVRKAA